MDVIQRDTGLIGSVASAPVLCCLSQEPINNHLCVQNTALRLLTSPTKHNHIIFILTWVFLEWFLICLFSLSISYALLDVTPVYICHESGSSNDCHNKVFKYNFMFNKLTLDTFKLILNSDCKTTKCCKSELTCNMSWETG